MSCCKSEIPDGIKPKVRQEEPVSLFSESKEEVPEKIDYSNLNITEAVQHGASQRFHELLEAGVSPHTTEGESITLLHWAALNDRREEAGVLVERGVSVDSVGGPLHSTPLHWAAHAGALSVMSLLVSGGARLDLPDRDGCLPIHLAAGQGSTRCLVYLVARGQHVDTLDREGRTPLMIALARSESHDTVRQLVRLGASISCLDHRNNNPLHWAVDSGKPRSVNSLVNISQQDFCKERIRWEDKNNQGQSALDVINREKRYMLSGLSGQVKHYIRKDIMLRKYNNSIRERPTIAFYIDLITCRI